MIQQKRGYSRGGCRECKRRKIKCDENKPHCGKCYKLNKNCSYPAIGEKVPRVSKKLLTSTHLEDCSKPQDDQHLKKPLTIQMYSGPPLSKRKKRSEVKHQSKKELNSIAQVTSNHATLSSSPLPQFDYNRTASIDSQLYNDEDLNILASDLNNIVSDIMFTSNMNMNIDQSFFVPFDIHPMIYTDDIPRHVSIDSISLKTPEERNYLEAFYFVFAPQILPFGALDQGTKMYSNPIRDTLLSYGAKESFLLAAILSQGAKITYEKTNNQQDLDNYGSYLSTSLKLLGPALSKNRDKSVKDDLTSNIESILLTVLLLTSSNASTSKQSWRPHLKGAKDIIIKATNSKIKSSKTLILCKVWFADFEILAGMSSPLGGTLKNDDELNSIINFEDEYVKQILVQFGIVQDSFNVMFGYDTSCVHLFRDLSKILNKKRESLTFSPNESVEYVRLISGFYEHYEKTYVSRSGQLNSIQFFNLGDILYYADGSRTQISWRDISQQAFVLAGLITIFTSVLLNPSDSPHVKDLNMKLIKLIEPFKGTTNHKNMTFPYAFSMIQWPMIIAGVNCTEEYQRPIIIEFFQICYNLGSITAEFSIRRIEKLWSSPNNGSEYQNDESNENKIDTVAY